MLLKFGYIYERDNANKKATNPLVGGTCFLFPRLANHFAVHH